MDAAKKTIASVVSRRTAQSLMVASRWAREEREEDAENLSAVTNARIFCCDTFINWMFERRGKFEFGTPV